jgi:hypothetical protein
MSRLVRMLDVLVHPGCWISLNAFSRAWDEELTWLLDNGYHFTDIESYYATIGDHRIWIENHPYASFQIDRLRPRRATVLRAGRLLNQERERQLFFHKTVKALAARSR